MLHMSIIFELFNHSTKRACKTTTDEIFFIED